MSQVKDIARYLAEHKIITALEALEEFGCFRLAARIYDIRSKGIDIMAADLKLPNGKHVTRYMWVNTERNAALLEKL
jgi:hypothetical protein